MVYFPRALKTRGNTPKYGLIFHSSFIGRAGAKNKGQISRYLANVSAQLLAELIASLVNHFAEDNNLCVIFNRSTNNSILVKSSKTKWRKG